MAKRANYWLVSNPKFGISNLKVCNLSEFARTINEKARSIFASVAKSRYNKKDFAEYNDWIM